jgi:molybdopterin-containing oxidoreductase family iron-sulfur binding subunit
MTHSHHERTRLPLASVEAGEAFTRREMLRVMAAAMAMAGGASCRQPSEQIVPYVNPPEGADPSVPLQFATATTLAGSALGLLVTSRAGRPIKVEGNPDHPASLGATDAFAQALVLGLYDPDRSRSVLQRGQPSTWDEAFATLRQAVRASAGGSSVRVLSEPLSSPTLIEQRRALLRALPDARWHVYEPLHRHAAREGARRAFGQVFDSYYRVEQARVLLAIDIDLFCDGPAGVRYAREFAAGRALDDAAAVPRMKRMYAVESTPTLTGTCADHRLALPPAQISGFVHALARQLGVEPPAGDGAGFEADPRHARFLGALVQDLRAQAGAALVALGPSAAPELHALVHRIHAALGSAGRTVMYIDPLDPDAPDPDASLAGLCADMLGGRVQALLVLGGNPVFDAPSDLDFRASLAHVPLSVHLGLYADETAERCSWHLPEAHLLERWSDTLAYDGTATIVQPLIAPLYDGKTAHEVLAAALGSAPASGYEIVRATWQRFHAAARTPGGFDTFWNASLNTGVVAGTQRPPRTSRLLPANAEPDAPAVAANALELIFRPDPSVWDGRFANNSWLQECPRPLTKITWDNALLIAPATAARLSLEQDQVVVIEYRGRSLRAPVCILPRHAEDCATIQLGNGRTRAGRVGNGVGFDAYALRTSDAPWGGPGLHLRATSDTHELVRTHGHHRIEGRDIVRAMPAAQLERGGLGEAPELPSLLPPREREGHAWGMTIDLAACTGCNACVIACQAENNVPTVGKHEVSRQREMHWLRIDSYEEGEAHDPHVVHEVVMCMHCETAPCELVCPVGATVHDTEGLNEMVYNRCIGTRYCSNNCPYKVRRFNFFHYSRPRAASLAALYNPEVTVRSRGVMEKCTYCVQRIQHARIAAGKALRPIHDGEIETACQAACPSRAITFGDLNDAGSRVARLKQSPRNYELLRELDTRPRTSYLARLTNPNPNLREEGS